MKFLFTLVTKVVSLSVVFCATMGIGLAIYAASLLPNLPTVEQIREIPLNVPLRIYSSDEKLIAEYGNERRIPVTLDEAPPLLIDALLATEDDRFYHHTGVDFPGIARALISNIRSQSRSQGASTITMQVARNFFLNPEKTYTRKLKEMLLAFNMERALTKDEILELYLNKIFLGHRSYGFAAAAQVYYGEELKNLSVPEIAMLAGLPKAPSRDNPISNPKRAEQRRDYVLRRLHTLGKIDDFALEKAQQAPVTATQHVADVDLQAPFVAEMARQILFDKLGDAVYESGLNVVLTIRSDYQQFANQTLRKGIFDYDERHGYRGPAGKLEIDPNDSELFATEMEEFEDSQELKAAMVVSSGKEGFVAQLRNGEQVSVSLKTMQWARPYLTANSMGEKPDSASAVVAPGDIVYVKSNSEDDDTEWHFSQMPDVSGALVSLDPNTGEILALSGGFDYYLSKFNRATQALRQPGSNIKPFIYSAAMEHGFSPGSLVSAAPIVIEDDLEGVWRPENYSKQFFGPTRLRKALSLSLNLVSVRLLRAMGIDTTIDHLAKFGFEPDQLPRALSLSLGSTQVTPIGLASSYAVIANGGYKLAPYLIREISDPDGNQVDFDLLGKDTEEIAESVEEGNTPEDKDTLRGLGDRVISEENAFLTRSIMKQVILSGTGQKALRLGRNDLAGKTGTTNDYKDAWFSGFNSDVITTVYIGFDEPEHLGRRESGASAALPIWVDFMEEVLKDFPEKEASIPENIVSRMINKTTGEATSSQDPEGYQEYFLTGTEPTNAIQTNVAEDTPASGSESVSETLF
ncbi:MAG: penicillin-binding protein 1A [Pseudomonadota bacterium]